MKKLLLILAALFTAYTVSTAQCTVKQPAWPTYSHTNCTMQSMKDSADLAIWWLLNYGVTTNIFNYLAAHNDTAIDFSDTTMEFASKWYTLPKTVKNTYITDIDISIVDSLGYSTNVTVHDYNVLKLDLYTQDSVFSSCVQSWAIAGGSQFVPVSMHFITPLKIPIGFHLKMDLKEVGTPANKIGWMLNMNGYRANF